MKVLHVAASLADEWGGPVTVLRGLTAALRKLGVECAVVATVGYRVGGGAPLDGVPTYFARTSPLARLWTAHSWSFRSVLDDLVSKADLIHIHELWHYPHWAAYRAALRNCVPYIVTPHGELGSWHLKQKAWKKKFYLTFVQRTILRRAAAVHAITEAEVDEVLHQAPNATIRVIPNGVDLDAFRELPHRAVLEEEYPQLRGKKTILFLGRLHKVKGLDLLAHAFSALARTRDDLALIIAGPDEGFKAEVDRMLCAAGVANRTVFTGLVTGPGKLAVLAASDVLVLPSHGEARGLVVLEAMASGLPVVISKQCKFQEVAEAGAGLVVGTDVAELTQALQYILEHPDQSRAMGQRGKKLVREKYSWDAVAGQMVELYRQAVLPLARRNDEDPS